ncbi:aldolase/citrate lyase family protein [uncultured Ruegeria sp.]|uniref:aldolase/citrate lyase family protein n=1 Tax=uncultured Ruegeria sp. TaxID=259304 RepID=UPI00261FDEBD|nr:aldolase/citrate lyase family protein [uncultured Ruegeria sp.]
MPAPTNRFKIALNEKRPQIGCWIGLADAYAAEISATAGFDWLLVDGEHAPNNLRSILEQVRVIESSDSIPLARLPIGEIWMIKQYLDAGIQSLLIPMVESKNQAAELVRAVRYPPMGARGVGSSLARASRFAAIPDYLTTADDQICLIAQVENRAGMAELDGILETDLDGVFIGPADLAADMGHIGQADHPEVKTAVLEAIKRIVASGKAAGILTTDPEIQRECLDLGATFVATDIDVTRFATAMRASAKQALSLLPDQTATGQMASTNGGRYLQQLCKHWSHKAVAKFDDTHGRISFADGKTLEMSAAKDHLAIVATTGPRGDLDHWKQVIEQHLLRFAFREDCVLHWDQNTS